MREDAGVGGSAHFKLVGDFMRTWREAGPLEAQWKAGVVWSTVAC
jgi:hypothetical protein